MSQSFFAGSEKRRPIFRSGASAKFGPQIVRIGKATVRRFRSMLLRLQSLALDLFARVAVRSQFTSMLYYAVLAPGVFGRECRGVLYGMLKHPTASEPASETNYFLRRQIHRLEKGLIMRPRREVFAADYIGDTVDLFCAAVEMRAGRTLDGELLWSYDVLHRYFEAVGSHPQIAAARARFSRLPNRPESSGFAPYKRNLSAPPPVSFDEFLALSQRRRSVRWYEQKPVPREMIDQAIYAAAYSPSACNRQPFEFRVFDDPEMGRQVADLAMGTTGFSQNFPVVIAVVGKLRAYFSGRDRHLIYIDGGLATMSLVLALETLGLSSCTINWPDIEHREKAMADLLRLEPDERVIMLISAGFPDPEGLVPYSKKMSLSAIRRYNVTEIEG